MSITPAQIRAARALLGIHQADLAQQADIGITTLTNIETGKSDPRASTLDAIQAVLERAGANFTDGGVTLRR